MTKRFNCNDCKHRSCKYVACINGSRFEPKKDDSKISIELDKELVDRMFSVYWKMTNESDRNKSEEEIEAQKILAHICDLCDR